MTAQIAPPTPLEQAQNQGKTLDQMLPTDEDKKRYLLNEVRNACTQADWRFEFEDQYNILVARFNRVRIRIYQLEHFSKDDYRTPTPYSTLTEYERPDTGYYETIETVHYFPSMYEAARRTALWIMDNLDTEYEIEVDSDGFSKAIPKREKLSGKNTL